MDLDGFISDHRQHFGGFQLGHRHIRLRHRALIVFPSGFAGQKFGSFQLHRHISEFKADPLELADLLAELLALCSIRQSVAHGAFCAPKAGRGDLQPRGAQPRICNLEPLMHLAQDLAFVQAAIVKFQHRVGIAAVRDVAVTVAHVEPLGALIDKERRDFLFWAARGVFFACRHKDDGKACQIGVADEMLGAVQNPVVTIRPRRGLHTAQV